MVDQTQVVLEVGQQERAHPKPTQGYPGGDENASHPTSGGYESAGGGGAGGAGGTVEPEETLVQVEIGFKENPA